MAQSDGDDRGDLLRRGVEAHRAGRLEEAEQVYSKILETWPTEVNALNNFAVLKKRQGDLQGARKLLETAFASHPDSVMVATAFGNLCLGLGDLSQAERAFARVLGQEPRNFEVLKSQADLLRQLGRTVESIAHFDRALELQPDFAAGWAIRGGLKSDLGDFVGAEEDYAKAVEVQPNFPKAWNNYGQILRQLYRFPESLAAVETALRHQPDFPLAKANFAQALSDVGRTADAAKAWLEALAQRPDHLYGYGLMLQEQLKVCDWSRFDETVAEIRTRIRQGKPAEIPWPCLAHTADPYLQLQCAQIHLRERFPSPFEPIWRGETYNHDKIRVAYVSTDFRNHAVSHLIAGLFKRHDRTRFEVTGLALGPASDDFMRQRIAPTFDQFIDIKDLSDLEAARLIRDHEIDILVDLNGFTTHCRPGIFAHRPAPVQVNFLGHPGSMGASFMDYIIGDQWVTPKAIEDAFSEAVIRMPHSYQVNDMDRGAVEAAPSRAAAGLPESGFVFCCFNANFKITPDVFAIWMRLLQAIPGSVFWIFQSRPDAAENLRRNASEAGVDPGRLVFAPPMGLGGHLARHQLADLFLDTFHYNAHTTGSDALWAGLPMITMAGEGFASRVAASLLDAVGLPELITHSPQAYEQLALDLAQNPQGLALLREKLAKTRAASPLFDTDRYCRSLEQAYQTVYERAVTGLEPAGFDVVEPEVLA